MRHLLVSSDEKKVDENFSKIIFTMENQNRNGIFTARFAPHLKPIVLWAVLENIVTASTATISSSTHRISEQKNTQKVIQ